MISEIKQESIAMLEKILESDHGMQRFGSSWGIEKESENVREQVEEREDRREGNHGMA